MIASQQPFKHLPLMRNFRHVLLLAALAATSRAAPPPVGSVSDHVDFAVHNGSGFDDADLSAYDGKILVLMLMTPW